MEAGIEPTWAEEVLRERGRNLKADDLRTVTLLATGSQEAADEAWLQRADEQMRSGHLLQE